jgi:hypothetical protein
MTTFDDRERGFESKYAHDQETEFKVMGRRNRLLGEWAGALLGHSGEALTEYTRSVVRSDFAEAGDDDVLRKVAADLSGKADEAQVRAKMQSLLEEARQQVQTGR